MNQKNDQNGIIDFVVMFMIVFLILGVIIISIFFFSFVNLISYLAGGAISILNFIWLKRLIKKLIGHGKFTKKSGLEWGVKILIIFGLITVLILKTKINILIFIIGLSILPFAVILQSVVSYLKTIGGR